MTLSASATEYLFKLREDAAILCDDAVLMSEECFEDDSSIARVLGVYTTDDISVIEKYLELGLVEFYEENGEAELLDMPQTSDFMTIASGVSSSTVPLGQSYNQINVQALWDLGLTGKGITVAVIDSGVNAHKDIVGNLLPGYNYSLTDAEIAANPSAVYDTTDIYSHGTMVAGLIAANGSHYRGIAPEAKVIPLKCFKDSNGRASLDDLAEAMIDAVDKYGCDIINMSCGSVLNSTVLREATEYVNSKGIPVIAAAGNSGSAYTKTDDYYYPASYDSAVSVANIQKNDTLKSSSQKNDKVDISAPGTETYGIDGSTSSGYINKSGTSFSCPIVTGIATLMLQANPQLSDNELQQILCETATDLGDVGKDVKFGYGKVNCDAIVPRILGGKLYRSNIVEYKGTHNIAMRNGLANTRTVKKINIEFSDTGASETQEDISLVTGESIVLEAPDSKVMKLIYESEKGYEMLVRNGSVQSYTTMLLAANYDGAKMNNLGGRRLDVQSGGASSVLIPHYVSGSTKLFLVDVSKFTARLLSQYTAE